MTGDTEAAVDLLRVMETFGLPILLAVLTGAVTLLVTKVRAKNDRIKQEQDHALALAAQQAEFEGRKKEAAQARDKQMFDIQKDVITSLQTMNRDGAHREARMDQKFDELYASLGEERAHILEWEDWYRAGMPPPPPRRKHRALPPHSDHATSTP